MTIVLCVLCCVIVALLFAVVGCFLGMVDIVYLVIDVIYTKEFTPKMKEDLKWFKRRCEDLTLAFFVFSFIFFIMFIMSLF
jgi:hypothetical protein